MLCDFNKIKFRQYCQIRKYKCAKSGSKSVPNQEVKVCQIRKFVYLCK